MSTDAAPAQQHGRAGRNVPVSIVSAVVLIAVILATLLIWKPLFMVVVAAAVTVAIWELIAASRPRTSTSRSSR